MGIKATAGDAKFVVEHTMNPKSEVLIVAVLVALLACVQCQVSGNQGVHQAVTSINPSIIPLQFTADLLARLGQTLWRSQWSRWIL